MILKHASNVLPTGIEIPRPAFAREKDFGYVLKREDAGILKSIAKQVSQRYSMTIDNMR